MIMRGLIVTRTFYVQLHFYSNYSHKFALIGSINMSARHVRAWEDFKDSRTWGPVRHQDGWMRTSLSGKQNLYYLINYINRNGPAEKTWRTFLEEGKEWRISTIIEKPFIKDLQLY